MLHEFDTGGRTSAKIACTMSQYRYLWTDCMKRKFRGNGALLTNWGRRPMEHSEFTM